MWKDCYKRRVIVIESKSKRKVKCPVCGYEMPIFYTKEAQSRGISVSCKGRNCSSIFEIKMNDGKQIK